MESENLSKIEKLSEVKQWTLWKFQIRIKLKTTKTINIVERKKTRPIGTIAEIEKKK